MIGVQTCALPISLQFLPVIVDVLPGLIVHLEGAHFGSSPRDRIAHFDGAGAGGKFATISGQYLDKLKVRLYQAAPTGSLMSFTTMPSEYGRPRRSETTRS